MKIYSYMASGKPLLTALLHAYPVLNDEPPPRRAAGSQKECAVWQCELRARLGAAAQARVKLHILAGLPAHGQIMTIWLR